MKFLIVCISNIVILASIFLGATVYAFQQKASARLRFEYFKTMEDEYLKVTVLTRVERRYVQVEGVKIDIYLGQQSVAGFLGSITSGADGIGIWQLDGKYFQAKDSLSQIDFIAVLENDPNYRDSNTDLSITKVKLETNLINQDSLKFINVTVMEMDNSEWKIPEEQVEVIFLVDRYLSPLPIATEYTDDQGSVSATFPTDLPGGENGLISIIIRIEDSDYYGNFETRESANWGIPAAIDYQVEERSLWAAGANAPILLLLLVNSLILVTWGIIIYIVVRLFQIRRV